MRQDVPAVQRKATGERPLTMDQVRAPRPGSRSDVRNLGGDTAKRDAIDLVQLTKQAR